MDDEDWDAEIGNSNSTTTNKISTFRPMHSNEGYMGRGRLFNRHENNSDSNKPSFYKPRSPVSNNRSQITDYMNIETRSISQLIGKAGSTINNIRDKCSVKIIIPSRDELVNKSRTEIKIIGSSRIDIEKSKQMIEDILANNLNPSRNYYESSKNRSPSFKRNYEESFEEKEPIDDVSEQDTKKSVVIDWDLIRSKPLQNLSKFKDQPDIIKNFYVEDPEITKMSREEVKQFRKNNFDIKVEFFKKENLNYCVQESDKNEPELSEQELEDLIFKSVPKPVKTIEQAFKNYPEILEECRRQNFLKPTPIQSQIWPILLKGLDCVGIAQTGTGKTLGFLLPALVHIDNQTTPREKRLGPNVLVLSPTRELAIQIEQEVKKINYKNIKSVCVYGGGDRKEQVNVCTRGVEIIIATPGRLYDLIQAKIINVTSVTYLVLDEADRMLDMGFEPQIMKILLDIRPDRQTVMTSATWPQGVRRLATKYLTEPIQLYVGSLDLRAAKTVTQLLEMVKSEDEKRDILMDYIYNKMTDKDKLIVFVGRKSTADNLSCELALKNVQCQAIHGDREQCDREEALEDFKENRVRILIATDVASRGIDVKDITCVVNYDFPRNIEEYVHRVGRTGRAGRTGTSITFMSREDWKHAQELIDILKQGDQEVPQTLVDMAERFEAAKKKRMEEGSDFRRGGFGFGGRGGNRSRGRDGGNGGRGGGGFFF